MCTFDPRTTDTPSSQHPLPCRPCIGNESLRTNGNHRLQEKHYPKEILYIYNINLIYQPKPYHNMKKLRYYFSLLLALIGIGAANAQWEEGAMVEDIAAVASAETPVVLKSSNLCGHNPGKYVTPKGFVEAVSESALYKIVATGEEFEGLPTYRLVNVENGMFLRAEQYGADEDTSGGVVGSSFMHTYTADVTNAFTFTAQHPIAGSDDPRTKSSIEDLEGWIFCETTEQPEGMGYGYFGTYDSGFMGIYTDTNVWQVYEANKLSGADALSAWLNANLPNGLSKFQAGTNPGSVPQNLYDALNTAYQAALTLANTPDATVEACQAAQAELEKALAAAEEGIVSIVDGKYYYIINMRSNSGLTSDGTYVYAVANYAMPTSETATVTDANFFWKAEKVDDGIALKNYAVGLYAPEPAVDANGRNAALAAAEPLGFTIEYNTTNERGPGLFNIKGKMNYAHISGSYGWVRWNSINGDGNLYAFYEVDAATMEKLAAEVKQNQLNEQLAALYDEAYAAWGKGRAFTSNASADGLFDDPGLVTDGAALSTNAPETGEHSDASPTQGDVENLADGDFTTFFHSRWKSATEPADPDTWHYVQADLGDAYQTLAIKYAKRHNNQTTYNPTKGLVYAADDPEGEWTLCGAIEFSYPYSANVNATETANFVGITGFQLDAPHRYVRIAVTERQNNGGGFLNGQPFFYLSELHFYEAQLDEANSPFFAVSEATRNNFKAALDAAKAAQGAATEEIINNLRAAYDAFIAEFPDASVIETAIANAKTAIDGVPVGTEMGYYPQEALDQVNNTIAEVEASLKPVMTLDEIQAGVKTVEDAVTAFRASLIMPEVGKTYIMRGITQDSGNARALNAIIYSLGNGSDALRSKAQTGEGEDKTDPVSPAENLGYVWLVTKVENGKIALRNLNTGYWIGEQPNLNGNIMNVAEETLLPLQSAKVGGGFNLVVGDGLYMNFAGQREVMVAWSSASGADNGAFRFEEFDPTTFNGTTQWTVTGNYFRVVTLPFEIFCPSADEGTAYSVLGQKENEDGSYNIELKAISDDETIPAGMPFIFQPTTENATGSQIITCLFPDDNIDILNIPYAAEAKNQYVGDTEDDAHLAIAGTLSGLILPEGSKGMGVLRGGTMYPVDATSTEAFRTVAGNSGYIFGVPTEETGDASIRMTLPLTTGIGTITINGQKVAQGAYTISGVRVNAEKNLPAGVYIINGKKVIK